MIDRDQALSAHDVLQHADKIIPTLRATEKTRKVEMQKLIDQVEKNIGQIGPFARVYGEKRN